MKSYMNEVETIKQGDIIWFAWKRCLRMGLIEYEFIHFHRIYIKV